MKYISRTFPCFFIGTLLSGALHANASESVFDPYARLPGDVAGLSTSGSSGSLNLPDGRTLPDGVIVLGFNNALDPQFSQYARGENMQFGIGLFRYLEISGRLVNYPINKEGALGMRDLSANVKISIPKILRYQPDIAIGINDIGGGAANFQSKYLAVSETLGPLRFNVGSASGQPYLSRFFGGVELALGNSGLSVLAERNDAAWHGGLRYASTPISFLGNTHIVAMVQHSTGARTNDGRKYTHSGFGINLVMPFGENAARRRADTRNLEPIWTPPPGYGPQPVMQPLAPDSSATTTTAEMQADKNAVSRTANDASGTAMKPIRPQGKTGDALSPVWTPPPGYEPGYQRPVVPKKVAPVAAPVNSDPVTLRLQSMQKIRAELVKAGLERVKVGLDGDVLLIEYENHRYNQNETDAIGIVLAVGTTMAPNDIKRVAAITKKAGLALYSTSADRAAYREFIRVGDIDEARLLPTLLVFQNRPSYGKSVQWLDTVEGPRGYVRLQIDPSLTKFVGTEVGVLDYSLAANLQAFVPLWNGAELTTSYIARVAESENVRHGVFSYAQQQAGLKAVTISQSFWLSDQLLNVTSAGKFMYNNRGVQNETVFFVPGRDDQVRLQYSYFRNGESTGDIALKAGSVSYLWNYQPLNVSVEAGYNRYTGQDSGPSIQINRWFGNVQAQLFARRNDRDTKIGFGLAFPLTPRQGMSPGLIHIEGPASFPLRLETKFARQGECNCITKGVVEEMPLVYSSRSILLNQGRLGKDYLLSQLQRMRDAALMYATFDY